jgi:hypothetical protein
MTLTGRTGRLDHDGAMVPGMEDSTTASGSLRLMRYDHVSPPRKWKIVLLGEGYFTAFKTLILPSPSFPGYCGF